MDAVIFDLDGVLVDSEPAHGRAIAQVCAEHGIDFEIAAAVGLPDDEAFRRAWRDAGHALDDADLDGLLRVKRERFAPMIERGEIKGYPGAQGLVRDLARLTLVGVCSAGLRGEVMGLLQMLGVADLMGAIVTAEDVENPKPAPHPYLCAAAALGAEPGRCIAVEDSTTGVASARAAGCYVIALTHTTNSNQLRESHEIIASIHQLAPRLLALLTRVSPIQGSSAGASGMIASD